MNRLVVAEHAFKHGLNEESIRYAWENRMASQHRKAPYEDQVVAIGLTEDGRVVELVGSQKPSAVVIYHAMEPPTKSAVLFDGCNYRPLLFSNPLFRGFFHF